MEFKKNLKNFSFGFSSEKIAGTGSGSKKYNNILVDGSTLTIGENSAYKGIGCISGNNSSRLLLDYKALHPQIYHEILRLLFEKGYGAELSHIKLEFGADINSSSGTEPSTMRSADENPDVTRGAGFIFAADALKINPELTIDLLRWGEPGWVKKAFELSRDKGYEARYKWYIDTIDEAYNRLGIKFTHISPDANETGDADADWLIYFSERLKSEKNKAYDYASIKIVASDEVGTRTIAAKMLENEQLRNAVDIIGLHYTTYGDENTEKLFHDFGKEIWYSEGIAPSNIPQLSVKKDMNGLAGRNGAVDVANRIINGWSHGKMTMYEFQPAVAAYYDGSCYYPKHIIRANEPWSGNFEIGAGFYTAMHFTRFIGKNWYPVSSACFGDGEENHYIENTTSNYLTLMPENRSDFTMIFTNDSTSTRYYRISFANCDFSGKTISFIETAGPKLGKSFDSSWFRRIHSDVLTGDILTVSVKPQSILTVTTSETEFVCGTEGFSGLSPKRSILPLPYHDDFSYSSFGEDFLINRGFTPLYTTDQGGAFEIINLDGKNWIEQKIISDCLPENWRFRGTPNPITCLGDDCWANYTASVKIRLCGEDKDNYAGLGVRYNSAVACEYTSNCGFAVKLFYSGKWELLFMDDIVERGELQNFTPDTEHTLSVTAAGNLYIAYLNGKMLGSYTEKGCLQANGRISLLSSYHRNLFTDLEIQPVPSMNSYVNAGDALDPALIYSGEPELKSSESYKYSNRTCAIMHEGDGFETCYMGCGFALCGTVENASLTILFDGKIISENKKVGGTAFRQAFYRCDCPKNQKHTIKLIVNEGEIILDSILTFTGSPFHKSLELPQPEIQVKSKSDKALDVGKTVLTAAAGTAAFILIKKYKKKHKK